MTEPLAVDAARLKAAGATLQALALPAPPPPMRAPGADAVSSAINATMPVIESPVVTGLPAVEKALTRTGSSIVAAAAMYAEADQALGEHVGGAPMSAAAQQPTGSAATGRLLGATAKPKDDDGGKTPARPDKSARPPAQAPATLGQLGAMGQAMGPVTQGMQTMMSTVQQAAGGLGGAGATPARLADDTTDMPGDATRLVDDTTQPDGAGAAAGDGSPGSASVRPPTARPAGAAAAETPG
ncbi:hypothetical protein [Mycobacterium scrofulaceum]|uniref:hypothetical protein n=1 Tax=Mycobacterium scrofulaceum TaxID=1783 RepID=UPI00114E199A|nr:hypothetical protein [Mycobacterium scrofulaceum]